jgi:hypothetical protein
VDHEGQRDLVEPGIERLADKRLGRVVADRCHDLREAGSEAPGAGAEEPARVEIEIAAPELVGVGEIERPLEIEAEAVVERGPCLGIAGAVELDLGPGVRAGHRGRGAREVEGKAGKRAGDERVGVEEQEGAAAGECRETLGLVAVWIGGAEVAALEGDDRGPEVEEEEPRGDHPGRETAHAKLAEKPLVLDLRAAVLDHLDPARLGLRRGLGVLGPRSASRSP